MKIFVDADASPVKDSVAKIGKEENVPVVFVLNYAHYSPFNHIDGVETIYVDTETDSSDYKIIHLAKEDDIIITQDYGLASLALGKGCIVLHHNGFRFTNDNINQLLQSRYVSSKARKAGIRMKGPKPYTNEQKEKFEQLLRTIIKTKKKHL